MNRIASYIIATAFLLGGSIVELAGQTPMDEAVRRADVPPAWPDCDALLSDCTKSRMADFIAANLQIPLEAKAENAGGLVMMEFVVEKNGMIGEVKPVHDPGLGLGEEATRVINLMKTKKIKWTPAKLDGKKVAYRYTVPISFNLNTPVKPPANATTTFQPDQDKVYDIVEQMPKFAGCEEAKNGEECTFSKVVAHINSNLKYPQEAIDQKVEGQAVVEFVVDINGAVLNPTIVKGLGAGCDEEVLRVVGLMPTWIPGQVSGVPVKVKMKLPVMFQLPKEKSTDK